jgi:benzoyl-CoA reductase/2-hydroxyglutaryl-CoA dehydratase subunit BcrC/BadD/HgdB
MINMSQDEMGIADAARFTAAADAKAAGRLVVGLVGVVVPPELVLAAGCFPVTLTARADDWARSAEPMEDGHEPEVRSIFMQAIAGEFDLCDLVVIPSTSDALRFLFQYMKEMVRQGRAENIPPILHYDLLLGRSAPVRRHSVRVFERLAHRLEVLSGRTIDDAALQAAITSMNRVRQQWRRLDDLRRAGRVAGSAAHAAIRAAAFLSPEVYAGRLAQWLEALPDAPAHHDAPRFLLVPAVPLYHERLHTLVEAAGGVVEAEDDEWGARSAGPDIEAAAMPAEAIFAHYYNHACCPRMPQAEREAWLESKMAEGRLDGVIFYVPPSDQFFGWRYPDLKAHAERCGLPTLLIREEVLDPAAAPAIAAQIADFIATPGVRARPSTAAAGGKA